MSGSLDSPSQDGAQPAKILQTRTEVLDKDGESVFLIEERRQQYSSFGGGDSAIKISAVQDGTSLYVVLGSSRTEHDRILRWGLDNMDGAPKFFELKEKNARMGGARVDVDFEANSIAIVDSSDRLGEIAEYWLPELVEAAKKALLAWREAN